MACSKCGGLIVDDHGDVRCLNCGSRLFVPEATPICRGLKKSGRCTKKAMRNSPYCAECDRAAMIQRGGRPDVLQKNAHARRILNRSASPEGARAVRPDVPRQEAGQAAVGVQGQGRTVEVMAPHCRCGNVCQHYGPQGGYSVSCVICNERKAQRQRLMRRLRKARG